MKAIKRKYFNYYDRLMVRWLLSFFMIVIMVWTAIMIFGD